MALLLTLIVVIIVFAIVLLIYNQIPLEEPFKNIGKLVILLLFVLILLGSLVGWLPPLPVQGGWR